MGFIEEWRARIMSNPFKYAAILLVIVLVFFFFLLPAWRGYKNNKALQSSGIPDKYISNISGLYSMYQACDQDLSVCKTQLVTSGAALDACNNNTVAQQTTCSQQIANIQGTANAQIATLNGQLGNVTATLSAVQTNLSTTALQLAKTDLIISDAARRICCVKRIDDPKIDGYTTVNNRVDCIAGSGMNLTC